VIGVSSAVWKSSSSALPDPLDLSLWEDEMLVLLVRECQNQHARNVLVLRHWEEVNHLVCGCAWREGLRCCEDRKDAQQNAFFAIVRAIDRYDLGLAITAGASAASCTGWSSMAFMTSLAASDAAPGVMLAIKPG
jgi:hypothetical protein